MSVYRNKASGRSQYRACPACNLLIKRGTSECPYCAFKFKRNQNETVVF